MKFHVTYPRTADTVLKTRLLNRWRSLPNASGEVTLFEAPPYTTHGELLTQLWQSALDSPDTKHVFSEHDFIVYDTARAELDALLDQVALVLVPYCTRDPSGLLLEHAGVAGAWLIGVNKDLLRVNQLSLNWLAPHGQFNDAANGAATIALADGAVGPDDIAWLDYTDEAPEFMGLEYQSLGSHAFFARHFDEPPDTPLFHGYTLGQHLDQLVRRLDALEQK